METHTAMVVGGRLVSIDDNNRLHPSQGDPVCAGSVTRAMTLQARVREAVILECAMSGFSAVYTGETAIISNYWFANTGRRALPTSLHSCYSSGSISGTLPSDVPLQTLRSSS
jgi:hypothetical protein